MQKNFAYYALVEAEVSGRRENLPWPFDIQKAFLESVRISGTKERERGSCPYMPA